MQGVKTISGAVALIVGADSAIGAALAMHLTERGQSVVRTTRRKDTASEHRVFLDLEDSPEGWSPPCPVSVAYLCAAVTALRECRNEPERTAKVNVRNTVALATILAGNGTRIVFPSTSLVFDGSHPFERADQPVCPKTEYGRQKAEAERQLLALAEMACIVRLTKVIGPGMPLLMGWIDALRKGEAIHPFSDVVMSPVSLPFAVDALCRSGNARLSGIVQVSGNTDITYEQAARHVARRTEAREELVQPVASRDSGISLEFVPCYTTLDTSRLNHVLGLATPDVWSALDAALPRGETACDCRQAARGELR